MVTQSGVPRTWRAGTAGGSRTKTARPASGPHRDAIAIAQRAACNVQRATTHYSAACGMQRATTHYSATCSVQRPCSAHHDSIPVHGMQHTRATCSGTGDAKTTASTGYYLVVPGSTAQYWAVPRHCGVLLAQTSRSHRASAGIRRSGCPTDRRRAAPANGQSIWHAALQVCAFQAASTWHVARCMRCIVLHATCRVPCSVACWASRIASTVQCCTSYRVACCTVCAVRHVVRCMPRDHSWPFRCGDKWHTATANQQPAPAPDMSTTIRS